jgi:hypothetical protein
MNTASPEGAHAVILEPYQASSTVHVWAALSLGSMQRSHILGPEEEPILGPLA